MVGRYRSSANLKAMIQRLGGGGGTYRSMIQAMEGTVIDIPIVNKNFVDGPNNDAMLSSWAGTSKLYFDRRPGKPVRPFWLSMIYSHLSTDIGPNPNLNIPSNSQVCLYDTSAYGWATDTNGQVSVLLETGGGHYGRKVLRPRPIRTSWTKVDYNAYSYNKPTISSNPVILYGQYDPSDVFMMWNDMDKFQDDAFKSSQRRLASPGVVSLEPIYVSNNNAVVRFTHGDTVDYSKSARRAMFPMVNTQNLTFDRTPMTGSRLLGNICFMWIQYDANFAGGSETTGPNWVRTTPEQYLLLP